MVFLKTLFQKLLKVHLTPPPKAYRIWIWKIEIENYNKK